MLLPAPEPEAVSVVVTGQVSVNDAEADLAIVLGTDRTVERDDRTGTGCRWTGRPDQAGAGRIDGLVTRAEERGPLGWTVIRWVTRTVCLGVGELVTAPLFGGCAAVRLAVADGLVCAAG